MQLRKEKFSHNIVKVSLCSWHLLNGGIVLQSNREESCSLKHRELMKLGCKKNTSYWKKEKKKEKKRRKKTNQQRQKKRCLEAQIGLYHGCYVCLWTGGLERIKSQGSVLRPGSLLCTPLPFCVRMKTRALAEQPFARQCPSQPKPVRPLRQVW